VLATLNPGKLEELAALVADLPVEIVSQAALGVPAIEETGSSFADNAVLKARHVARATGLASIADDSGLEVDALGGAPGVHSARYAGPGANDAENTARLLAALRDVPAPRTARYRCVLAYVAGAEADAVLCTGVWEGAIAAAPAGRGGFGYDPVFIVGEDPARRTAAELTAGEKNARSHRARALQKLRARLFASLAAERR